MLFQTKMKNDHFMLLNLTNVVPPKANQEWLTALNIQFLILKELKLRPITRCITDLEKIDIDAIKCDSQGMELPILKNTQGLFLKLSMSKLKQGCNKIT